MMKSSNPDAGGNFEPEWEVRPGGMLVQKRGADTDGGGGDVCGSVIKIKVSHGSSQLELQVPQQSTFGDLKRIIAQQTGLEPKSQRLLFRGKEKDDEESLPMAGVKDSAKLLLMEDPACKERNLEEMKCSNEMSSACKAIADVRTVVDKLSEKVANLDVSVRSGTKVEEKEFVVLSELLMRQLLKLDSIEAEGEAKLQRKAEVMFAHQLAEIPDWQLQATLNLKTKSPCR